jgi:hypothetical protein
VNGPRLRALAAVGLLAALLALAGCLGTSEEEVSSASSEANASPELVPLPDEIGSLEHRGNAGILDVAKTLWIDGDRDLAYVTQNSAGFVVLDLSTPGDPTVVGREPDATGRDVDLIEHGDGTRTAVVADSAAGMRFVDVTDPREPELEATILGRPQANVHNVAVVPNTTIVYNGRSVDRPGVDVVDASDPENPEHVTTLQTGVPCHDVAFHAPDELATCAGVYQTQLWNVGDPADPSVVGQVTNPSITIHHWARPVDGGDLLVIGDEFLGATGPHAQGCAAGTENPTGEGTLTDPLGALWFYDISDPSNPSLEGWLGADEMQEAGIPPRPCTAHFGDQVGDRSKLVVSFIRGGVYLIDIADAARPSIVDHVALPGESWEVRVRDGLAYNTNTDRGVDVFGFGG